MAKRGGEPQDIDVAVGARIRIRRKQLGVSQADLADGIGVSFQQVQKYERGTNRVSASMLAAIAAVLQCSPASLFGSVDGDGGVDVEILTLISEDGALELLRAYARIEDREMRNAVISVADGLAGGAAQRALKRTPA
jgi:transcriptional regulator with XRE-family HTH domain